MIRTRCLAERLLSVLLLAVLTLAGGCSPQDVVYQRSVADLNTKAQQMLSAGDTKGAIARLESALDLYPDQVLTMQNLAIAYQVDAQYEKALALFQTLLKRENVDKAEIRKSLGIVHEAMGDQLMTQADPEALPPASGKQPEPAAEKLDLARAKAEAIGHYTMAIEAYQAALPGLQKDQQTVENQIQALQSRIEELQKTEAV